MEIKDVVTVVSVVVSIFSAYFAYTAQETAAKMAERKYSYETTMALLNSAFEKMTMDDGAENQKKQKISCYYIVQLAKAERAYQFGEPYILTDFYEAVKSAGYTNPTCNTFAEDIRQTPVAASETIGDKPNEVENLGAWHAVIASYDVTPKGCDFAKKDVIDFSRLLNGKIGRDLPISIVKTRISNNYAVTVDAGDDRKLAEQVSLTVRNVASNRDDPTGRDSFSQGNREWSVDENCKSSATVK